MNKILLIIGISQCFLLISCEPVDKDKKYPTESEKYVDEDAMLTGKQLFLKYCQSCHLYTEPSTLDKHTWQRSLLPLMGRLFGIYEDHTNREEIINGAVNPELVKQLDIFPHSQRISNEAWQKIKDYYISSAPDSLTSIEYEATSFLPTEEFDVVFPPYELEFRMTTLVRSMPSSVCSLKILIVPCRRLWRILMAMDLKIY